MAFSREWDILCSQRRLFQSFDVWISMATIRYHSMSLLKLYHLFLQRLCHLLNVFLRWQLVLM